MKPSSILSALVASVLCGSVAGSGGLLIPLYVWPTIDDQGSGYECVSEDYIKVADSIAADKTIAIVNPNNGPDYGGDSWKKLSFDTCIAYLQANGVEVIGYIHTKVGFPSISGYRALEDVVADVDQWYNEYSVDGIFIDEMTNRWPAAWDSEALAGSFYQSVVNDVLSRYSRAVVNPGGAYFESILAPYYGNSQVISVVFENMQWSFQRDNCIWGLWTSAQSSFDQGVFCPYVPNWDGIEPLKAAMESGQIASDQSAVMIYGAENTAEATADSILYGLADNVGWFYITDKWDWSQTPSQIVMDEQASRASAF